MADPQPDTAPHLPPDLPVLPLRNTVAFPLTLVPLMVNRPVSVESINRALSGNRMLLLLLQDGTSEDPGPDDLRRVGTVGIIRQMVKAPAGISVIVEGFARVRATSVTRTGLSLTAAVEAMPDRAERSIEADAYVRRLQDLTDRASSLASGGWSQELHGMVMGIDDPVRLCYLLASLLDMKADDKQKLLEDSDITVKLNAVAAALTREVALLELKGKIEIAGPAGDDRRTAAVLPAPAAQGNPAGTGRGRGGPRTRICASRSRRRTCPSRSRPSRTAKSVAWTR